MLTSKYSCSKLINIFSPFVIITLSCLFFKILWESGKISNYPYESLLSPWLIMVMAVVAGLLGVLLHRYPSLANPLSFAAKSESPTWHDNRFCSESNGNEAQPISPNRLRPEQLPSLENEHACIDSSDNLPPDSKSAHESISQFMANLTHELRTPLIGILGSVDLLEHSALNQLQVASVDVIKECGERLLNTIDDILEASKIEIGLLELNPARTNLPNLIKATVAALDANLSNRNLLLELDLDSNLPEIAVVDQVKLRQVITNLLANAIKFTPRGGIKVKVAVETIAVQDDWLLVTIADTGVGIAPQQMQNIFNHYTQAESSNSRQFGGNGLGLYICKKLIDLMGGEIWVQSKEGLGSTFGFTIPLQISADEHNQETSAPIAAILDEDIFNVGFTPVSVLLVEDNELNQKLLAQMLINYGFEVITASNGLECLNTLQRKAVDVILMDMQMPYMDGYEATRIIRENPSWERLPIIAVTANSLGDDRQKCLDCGCSSYLAKPFKSETLIREIKSYLKNQFIKEKNADLLSQQLIAELLPEFIEMMRETLDELKEAISLKDLNRIKYISHGIKGTAGMYGFMQISELAAYIEKASADKNYPRLNQLYQQIIALLKESDARQHSRVVI